MTEIVERLERQAVNVENDGHVSAARAMREAATALTEARAEIAVKERAIAEAARSIHKLMTRALAAESELSILRARVREVVGPFAAVVLPWGDIGSGMIDANSVRAARQLMEDLK